MGLREAVLYGGPVARGMRVNRYQTPAPSDRTGFARNEGTNGSPERVKEGPRSMPNRELEERSAFSRGVTR